MLLTTPLYVAKKSLNNRFLENKDLLKGVVLDLGCGKQPFRKYFDKYFGMDFRIYNSDFEGDVQDIPVKTESVDSVICSEVLEHVLNPVKAMNEISRVLKKGGVAYITVPMYWYIHYQPNDFWRFTCFSLSNMVYSSGMMLNKLYRYGGLNYFIANRISESIYDKLRLLFNNKLSLIFLAPLQVLLYWYSKLDKFNKKDVAGWVVVATKNS